MFRMLDSESIIESLYKLLLWLAVLLAPLISIMNVVVLLLFVDLVTGIWASVKRNGWKSIKASRMFDSVPKLILYNTALLTTFFVEVYIIQEVPLVRISAGFIAMIELKSVYENVYKVTGLKLWDAIKDHINLKRNKNNDTK